MPVKITSISDVNSFETGSVDFPIGNSGQWKTRTINVEGGVYTQSSQSNTFTFKTPNPQGYYEVERISGSWIEDGFEVGDTITFRNNSTVDGSISEGVFTGQIIEISDTIIVTDAPLALTSSVTYPSLNRNWSLATTIKTINAIEFKFNQLDNDSVDSVSMASIYDGTEAVMIAESIDASDVVTVNQMTQIGTRSGSTILNPTVKGAGLGVGTQDYLSKFTIEFTYKVSGEFQTFANILDNESPEWYENNNCLTNNFLVRYKTENNNPNVSIVNDLRSDITKKEGNTGWKGENYNGLPILPTVTSVTFRKDTELGDIITAPFYNNDTFVTIVIDDPNANAINSKYGFQFVYIPQNDSQWKNNDFSEAQNLMINSIREHELVPLVNTGLPVVGVFQGFENQDGARIDVVDPHLVVAGTTVTLKMTLRPNSLYQLYMRGQDDGNRLVSLQMSVGKPLTTQTNSDRSRIVLGNYQLDEFLADRGNYPLLESKFLQHNEDENDVGTLNPFGYIQDDLKHFARIPVNKNNTFTLTGVTSEITITKNSTGETGVLESNSFDLTGYPVTDDAILGDIIQANTGDTTRGFILSNDNKNNWYRLNRRSDLDTLNFWMLDYWYAFRLRFESWISAENLPMDLYNELKPLDNFNQNWLDKVLVDFTINYNLYIEVTETFTNSLTGEDYQQNSRFEDTFPIVSIADYEAGDLNGSVELFNSNNDSLIIGTDPSIYGKNINAIICDETVKCVMTFISPIALSDVSDVVYAYVDLYEWEEGTINSMYQLSTVVPNLIAGNPLEPIIGTIPTITLVDPNTITVEFNINSDNLPPSNSDCYAIGGRIQTKDGAIIGGKITEDDQQKNTEDDQNKIIE